MSERVSRRSLIGTALVAPAAAQHQGHGAPNAAAPAARHERFLAAHEFATLRILCDLILPADDVSPAASAAGTVEYIDLLCRGNEKIARIYHGGLAWLDAACTKLHGRPFAEVTEEQRIAILSKIADRRKASGEWKAGAEFFDWVRKMTLDGYYTSPAGYKDVGYQGGKGMTEYQVPEQALRQALSRWKP